MPPKPLKIVLIADIHKGADKVHEGHPKTLGSRALGLVKYLVRRINDEIRPQFVVQLGDLIENEDAESDEDNFSTVIDTLKQLAMPVFHVVGNQEQVHLLPEQIRTMLGYKRFYYAFDSGAFHFVVLFSTCKNVGEIHVDEAQRKWLTEDLAVTTKPTVVFIHHPLDDQELAGSVWYKDSPERCFVEERVAIREILGRSGKVRAVFNGHVHRNNLEIHDGVGYVSLQSLVENLSDTRKDPSESFAVVTLGEQAIKVEIEGMDPAEYQF